MSAWNDLATEEEAETGSGATPADGGQDSFGPTDGDDGFSTGSAEPFEDVEAVEQKKKGLNPKMVLAVMALVTTGVVGTIGWTVFKKVQPSAVVAAPVESMPADTVLLSDANAQAPVQAPVQPDQTSAAPADAPPAVAAAEPPVAPAAVVAVASDHRVADDSVLLKRMGEMDQRMNVIEGSLASIDSSIAQVKASVAAKPVTARASASPRRSSSNKMVRAGAAMPTLPQVQADATVMPLKLRGVYPPTGEDRQAWVFDPASGNIAVVSKGGTIGDSVVVRVDLDQIVTTRGVIR